MKNKPLGWRRFVWAFMLMVGVAAVAYAAPAPISLHTSVTLPVDM